MYYIKFTDNRMTKDKIDNQNLKNYFEKNKIKEIQDINIDVDFGYNQNVLEKDIKNLLTKLNKDSYRKYDVYNKEIMDMLQSKYKKLYDNLGELERIPRKMHLLNRYKLNEFEIEKMEYKLSREIMLFDILSFKREPFDLLDEYLKDKISFTIIKENGEKTIWRYGSYNKVAYHQVKDDEIEEGILENGKKTGEVTVTTNGRKKQMFYNSNGKRQELPIIAKYLNVDKERVNLDSYEENILYDLNKGHWEMDEKEFKNKTGNTAYYRNPRKDIKNGGSVGIDFGTKSTVVVYQEDNAKILPMMINGNVLNAVESNQYENPTVIEFANIDKFINEYRAKKGRPSTQWRDVKVSHEARGNLLNNPDSIFSIIDNLKQWCDTDNEKIKVRDNVGKEVEIPEYLKLKKEDIDPIEIYAYYIGSYINNMRNGIFLEYILSFPVTFRQELRKRILDSFTRGIKKSLPTEILEDKEEMKKFNVKFGANEPAAYIITAFEEYGFDEPDDGIYYGVFDFGGGTLDFDFGIYKDYDGAKAYDYELIHFNASGLSTVGGENILHKMAFETFKNNQNLLRKEKIKFSKPRNCDTFMGWEGLIDNNSQGAKINIKKLGEKLRDIWEERNIEKEEQNTRKVQLCDANGNYKVYDIKIDVKKLQDIIKKEIKLGVDEFFENMRKAFKDYDDLGEIKIFLAGNSSKHSYVKSYFEERIKEIREKENKDIKLYPALQTDEAIKLQNQRMEEDSDFELEGEERPSGKTGVAYGLLKAKKYKIIAKDEEENPNNEIAFRYYVGIERRKRLEVILERSTGYNNYKKVMELDDDYTIDIYYTESALAEREKGIKCSDNNVTRTKIQLNNELDIQDKELYIAAKGVDLIHWVVVEKGKINDKNYLDQGEVKLD